MRKLVGPTLVALFIAACGGSVSESTTSFAEETPVDAVTSTIADTATTSTAAPDPTTTQPPAAPAKFAITMVSLGGLAQVVVQNVGGESASLGGFWLCQRPSYYSFPDVELQPGEMAAVSVGGDIFVPPEGAIAIEGTAFIGPFDPAGGEVGLYRGDAFSDPDAILSYVEWGNSGHGRSGTAVSAGIWTDGGFVPTTAESGAILAVQIPPTEPAHWIGGG